MKNRGKQIGRVSPTLHLDGFEREAFLLTLFRFTRAQANLVTNAKFREIWDGFHSTAGFLALMVHARRDLSNIMKERMVSSETALALLLHDDLDTGKTSIRRDSETITKATGLQPEDNS